MSERFVRLANEANEEFEQYAGQGTSSTGDALQHAYAATMSVVADECGFGPLAVPGRGIISDSEWYQFENTLEGARLRALFRLGSSDSVLPVRPSTKRDIERHVQSLRELIEDADLDESLKQKAERHLDELLRDLKRGRLDLKHVLTVTAAIAAIISSSTVTLANSQKAKDAIVAILEAVHDQQEDEVRRLPAPPKALPPPESRRPSENKEVEE